MTRGTRSAPDAVGLRIDAVDDRDTDLRRELAEDHDVPQVVHGMAQRACRELLLVQLVDRDRLDPTLPGAIAHGTEAGALRKLEQLQFRSRDFGGRAHDLTCLRQRNGADQQGILRVRAPLDRRDRRQRVAGNADRGTRRGSDPVARVGVTALPVRTALGCSGRSPRAGGGTGLLRGHELLGECSALVGRVHAGLERSDASPEALRSSSLNARTPATATSSRFPGALQRHKLSERKVMSQTFEACPQTTPL